MNLQLQLQQPPPRYRLMWVLCKWMSAKEHHQHSVVVMRERERESLVWLILRTRQLSICRSSGVCLAQKSWPKRKRKRKRKRKKNLTTPELATHLEKLDIVWCNLQSSRHLWSARVGREENLWLIVSELVSTLWNLLLLPINQRLSALSDYLHLEPSRAPALMRASIQHGRRFCVNVVGAVSGQACCKRGRHATSAEVQPSQAVHCACSTWFAPVPKQPLQSTSSNTLSQSFRILRFVHQLATFSLR